MARFKEWIDASLPFEDDYLHEFEAEEYARKRTLWRLQKDLYDAAIGLGQTETQAVAKIDQLFSVVGAEWSGYIITGSSALVTAIQNDVTIGWLDTLVQGVSIRQRLINRLS